MHKAGKCLPLWEGVERVKKPRPDLTSSTGAGAGDEAHDIGWSELRVLVEVQYSKGALQTRNAHPYIDIKS